MNAGTADGAMADVVASVRILTPTGQVLTLSRQDLRFVYRKLEIDVAEDEKPIASESCCPEGFGDKLPDIFAWTCKSWLVFEDAMVNHYV